MGTNLHRFKADVPSVILFTRGRGRGHAVPDMALLKELNTLDGCFDLRIVSYGTGAETFRESGYDVFDLGLSDRNPFLETQIRCAQLIERLRPHLVISHEEFAAVPAASIFCIPSVFITDWFDQEQYIRMQSLQYAKEIVFIDEPGYFDEPSYLQGKITYVGPFVRPFTYGAKDRLRARQELGLRADSKVLTVLPGNWFTEARAPIFDLVMGAFLSLPFERKTLVWVAGADYQSLTERTRDYSDVQIKAVDWQMDRLMVSSDLCITKATRKTSIELTTLGIPSISLSYGLNRPDDVRVSRIPSNTHLDARTINSSSLLGHILEILKKPSESSNSGAWRATGLSMGARRLAEHINIVRKSLNLKISK